MAAITDIFFYAKKLIIKYTTDFFSIEKTATSVNFETNGVPLIVNNTVQVSDPALDADAATKGYVDSLAALQGDINIKTVASVNNTVIPIGVPAGYVLTDVIFEPDNPTEDFIDYAVSFDTTAISGANFTTGTEKYWHTSETSSVRDSALVITPGVIPACFASADAVCSLILNASAPVGFSYTITFTSRKIL